MCAFAHYWLNKGYIELYENGGKIWFTSSPSCHNSNSISKLECVLTLFFVPWFLREHTHTQKWLKFWHCPNCLEHFFIEGGFIYIFTGLLQGVLEGYCMIFLQFIAFSLKKKHSKYLHLGHQVFPLHTLYCIFRASLINPICKTSYMLSSWIYCPDFIQRWRLYLTEKLYTGKSGNLYMLDKLH